MYIKCSGSYPDKSRMYRIFFCIAETILDNQLSGMPIDLKGAENELSFNPNQHCQKSMDDTFLLSNIVPQDLDNNSDFWNRLEIYCRDLTKKVQPSTHC